MGLQTADANTEKRLGETATDAPTRSAETDLGSGIGSGADGPRAAVWDALTLNPGGATVTDIATAAEVSKTAARKVLAALADDGYATRTPGGRDGGKRTPDLWQLVTGTTPAEAAGIGDGDAEGDASPIVEPVASNAVTDDDMPAEGEQALGESTVAVEANTDNRELGTDETNPVDEPGPAAASEGDGSAEQTDAAAAEQAQTALSDLRTVITDALEALAVGDHATARTAAEAIYTASATTRRLVRAAVTPRPRNGNGRSKARPGELRAKVATHLATYTGQEFSPHEIGAALGHSSGAVANALDRLVSDGVAIMTSERPRRFTAAAPPANTTDTAVPAADEAADNS